MIRGLLSLYSWRYPLALVYMLQSREYQSLAYIRWYWRTTDFSRIIRHRVLIKTSTSTLLVRILRIGILLQISAGLFLIVQGWNGMLGGWQFGLALIVAYPLVWAHILPLIVTGWWVTHPKKLGREIVCQVLESQVQRLRRRHGFKVIAVVGSVGKTSTKMAIASILQTSRRVLWQEGNYNDRVTVPLIFFEHTEPSILNVWAWLRIFLKNERTIRRPYPYNVVVTELGTDGPGFMKEFAYTKPDIAIVTAISPEHMEYFGTLDAVAREELTVLHFAKQTVINTDDTPAEYLKDRNFLAYGLENSPLYHVTQYKSQGLEGQTVDFQLGKEAAFTMKIPLLGKPGAKIALAGATVAHLLGVPVQDIQNGIAEVSAFAGRMQILKGVKDSTLIDDTYNASPIAAKAALDVLQSGEAPQRIAILGSMNELGAYSPEAHREVGGHCDPSKLDWVITIGPDAKEYLAPVAKEQGCQVKTFLDPYKAGRFVEKHLQNGAVVLVKGSQNRVFAEEAIKVLLADKKDESKLVRQSNYWMNIKRKQFKS